MKVNLPNADAAASLRLSKNFSALPDELKLKIIASAVATPRVIDISMYFSAFHAVTWQFHDDEDLVAMANEQFDQVNTFSMPLSSQPFTRDEWSATFAAQNIRNLRVNFRIECTGGEFLPADEGTGQMRVSDVEQSNLELIHTFFPCLERLEICVDNRGFFADDISYTVLGVPHPFCYHTLCAERFRRMEEWMMFVDRLAIPPRRPGLKVEKRLIFVQSFRHQAAHQHHVYDTVAVAQARELVGGLQGMYAIHDAPVAICHFED